MGVAPKRNRADPCYRQSCHLGDGRPRATGPSGWSHPERGGQLPVSAHAARARNTHTHTRYTRAHTHTRSLDYPIVDTARAHTDGRQFAVCACSVTAVVVAIRKRVAVPHPNNHCSLRFDIIICCNLPRARAPVRCLY